jgi:hypothetical protein
VLGISAPITKDLDSNFLSAAYDYRRRLSEAMVRCLLSFSLTVRYYDRRVLEVNLTLEKLVIFRCHPEFKKSVDGRTNLTFAHMDPELWDYWCWKMSSTCPPDQVTTASVSYPDHGFSRHEKLDKLSWLSKLPPLISHVWWRSKFIYRGQGFLFRIMVTKLVVVRNSWTCECRAEFTYTCESWNDSMKDWQWH